MNKPRQQLIDARDGLGLNKTQAGQLATPSISTPTVTRFEQGAPASFLLRELCRAYMREAARLGYEPWDYHESALCPGEFPEPASRDEAALALILHGASPGRSEVRSPKSEEVA